MEMEDYKKYEPIFGSWYLKKEIGRGSFGTVYEIRKESYGGAVNKSALKIISVDHNDEETLKKVLNENEIMLRLKNSNYIVQYEDHQIIQHEEDGGFDVLIRMELLKPLTKCMRGKSTLEEEEIVKLGQNMCLALEKCHSKGIIHGDIKPDNIFISDDGVYKLGDFGSAGKKGTAAGEKAKKGAYNYMAPEVYRGERYDETADLYSLGLVLYTLLNENRIPFMPPAPAKATAKAKEVARSRRFAGEELPPPRDASVMLTQIIQKACAYNPADRYQDASQMKRDLAHYSTSFGEGTVLEEHSARDTFHRPLNQLYHYDEVLNGGGQQYSGQNQAYVPPAQPIRTTQPTQPIRTTQPTQPIHTTQPVQPIGAVPPAAAPVQKSRPGSKLILFLIVVLAATLVGAGVLLMTSGGDEAEESDELAGSVEYEGHHYKVVDEPMHWDEAKRECEAVDGHLAIIEDRGEQLQIKQMIEDAGVQKYHYWLGGYATDGTWKWLDGEPIPLPGDDWGFQNWEQYKPNNNIEVAGATGSEDYLELQTTDASGDYMTWNDVDIDGVALTYEGSPKYCTTKYFGYICEWDY